MKTNTLLFAKGVAFLFLLAIFSNIAKAQSFKWAKSGVSEGYDYGNAITSDDTGNVYVTGQLEFRCDFGGGTAYTVAGKHDILLGKYGPDGTLKWIRRAGGVGGDVGWGIGVDRIGNVYSTGEFELTAGWGPGDSLTTSGSNDIYLTKHSNAGNLIWVKKYGWTGDDKSRALTVDRDGNSYVTGYFSGTARFGTINVTSSGNNDVYIAKIDSAGEPLWVRKGGGTREDRGRSVVLDRQGNVFITGTFTQSATFNSTTLNSLGKNSLFVAKYDNNGNFLWAKGAGTCCDTTRGNAVSVDANGDVYIAGYFKDNTTIGSNSFTSFGASDIFVAKYDGVNGDVLWSKQAGGPYDDIGFACTFDTVKNQLYVAGQIDDHGYFGTIYVGAAGNRDVVIAAYDPSGTEIWARPGGGNQRDAGQAITCDTLNNIYTTGFFNDTASFGTTILQGYPKADFFVAKMAPPLSSQPSTNASAVTASLVNCNNIQLNFTAGNGTRRIVIAKAGSTVNVLPVDGNYYTASNTFGAGTDLGSGNFVVYDGTGTTATITGVTSGTNYYFGVFEYNGVGFGSNYLLPSFGTTNFISSGFSITASVFQNTICNGTSTLLHSSPNATSYSWSPANGLSSLTDSVVSAAPTSTMTYTVTASNGSGCTASQTLTIIVNQLPTVTFSSPATVCDNSAPVTLTTGSPSGGTYSGTGVSAGAFNPATAGIGTTTLTYSYTNVNNCTASATAPISVIAGPAVTHSAFNPICQGASLLTLTGGSPSGGVYSGTGVSSGKFNPSIAGPGTHTITYTYTSGGCSASVNTAIVVNPTPTVSLTLPTSVCVNASPITLTGGSPAGGIYGGTGVSGGAFNPTTAGTGTKTITYSYSSVEGCTANTSTQIIVNALPAVTLANFQSVCNSSSPITLSGGSPAGGVFTGNGITNGIFNPSTVGIGNTTVTYTYSDANGCVGTATNTISVTSGVAVTLASFSPICANSSSIVLTGGSPTGGTYSGTGVSGTTFNPTTSGEGTFAITYSYTNANGCVSSAQSSMVVNAVTAVTLSSTPPVCNNTSSFTLTGGTPSGGTYSGTGVSSNNFFPSVAGVGTTTITYTYTNAQGCASTATANQVVNAAPTVTLGSFTNLCLNASAITLADGSPAGGTFSGNGVSGTTFTPSVAGAGTTSIVYSYTDPQGCTSTANSPIVVDAAPNITLSSIAPLCTNSSAITLTNGSPAGGIYSGTGVTGNTFTPTNAGTTTLTYSVTAANGCSSSAQTSIVVNSIPVVTLSNFASVCVNGSPISLSGGQPNGGVYSGTGVSGGVFNPASGSGLHAITYTYTNANSCSNSTTANIIVNPAPTVNLGGDSLVCGEAIVVLNAGTGFTTVQWSTGSSASSITVDSSGVGFGTKSIIVTVTNSAGCLGRDTIQITFDNCSGIETSHEPAFGVYFYPNPFNGNFHILCERTLDYNIYDISGRLIESKKDIQGNYETGDDLAAGTYFIEFSSKDQRRVYQLVKATGKN